MSLIVSCWFLLDLIDNHKRIHGDTPFPRAPPSSRDQSPLLGHSHGARGGSGPPQNHGSWKRKYSLRHKSPQPPAAPPFISASSCSLRGASAIAASPSPGGGALPLPLPRPRNVTRTTTRGSKASVSQREHGRAEPSSAIQTPDSRPVFPAGGADPNPRLRPPPPVSEPEAGRTAGPAVAMAASVAAAPKPPPGSPSGHGGHRQASKSVSPVSKFVWVKTQNVKGPEPQHSSRVPNTGSDPPPPKPGAEGTVASPVWRKTPGRKPPRRPAQVSVSPKTSKYKWVSSQSKPSRKPPPSKLPLPQRAPETGGKAAKPAPASPAKARREGATWRSSHYSWKAAAAAGTAAPRRSSFYWTPEKRRASPGTLPCPPSPSPSSSPGPFKLHSRMKIIRRSANRSVDKNQLEPKVEPSW